MQEGKSTKNARVARGRARIETAVRELLGYLGAPPDLESLRKTLILCESVLLIADAFRVPPVQFAKRIACETAAVEKWQRSLRKKKRKRGRRCRK
jgi:hypothetical protein